MFNKITQNVIIYSTPFEDTYNHQLKQNLISYCKDRNINILSIIEPIKGKPYDAEAAYKLIAKVKRYKDLSLSVLIDKDLSRNIFATILIFTVMETLQISGLITLYSYEQYYDNIKFKQLIKNKKKFLFQVEKYLEEVIPIFNKSK